MVNADQVITIFNTRIDKKTRRELYVPTTITGVSFYDVQNSTISARMGESARSEDLSYKIRIPLTAKIQDSKTYLPEDMYKDLEDEDTDSYWTIQKGCYVIGAAVSAGKLLLTKEEVDGLVQSANAGAAIVVKEYADNTKRGTDAVKHWRIGGV